MEKNPSNREIILNAILSIGFALFMWAQCATCDGQVKRTGNNFQVEQVSSSGKGKSIETSYTFTDKDGKTYNIWISANGRAYIKRTSSKTGKSYNKYLPEDISREICREMGITYKEKVTK